MKTSPFLSSLIIALVGLCVTLTPRTGAAPDFGNGSSSDLTTNAWKALNNGQYQDAVALTSKCIESFKSQAGEQQRALKGGHTDTNSWALNDVGTCFLIRGNAYEKLGKNDKAMADYKTLTENYSLAEAVGDKGAKWKPAQAAHDKMVTIAGNAALGTSISAVSMNSITVGGTTYKIGMSTKVIIKGHPGSTMDLKTGMNASVTTGSDPGTADTITAN